ncbi:MAG: DNA mismatch repair protein MutS, partial [Halobaculum sp.]
MATEGIVGEFMRLREGTDADLLAMQCGDFYEFFAEDAETVAAELDLKISEKSSHGSSYPMAGVPVDDLTPYLKALVERGYRVAVADQYETNDGHAREVTRIVSPGTVLDPDDAAARYLAVVVRDAGHYGLAFVDVTTGRFHAGRVESREDARAELDRFDPVELVPGPEAADDQLVAATDGTTVTRYEDGAFAVGRARRRVHDQFGEATEAVGVDGDLALAAAGAALAYVEDTGVGTLAAISRLAPLDGGDRVTLDATTRRNLELTETMGGDRAGSLLATVDHTRTAAGRRRLREWLTAPTQDRAEIRRRHDAVQVLQSATLARDRVCELLDGTADLERLASRATSGSAGPRELAAIRDGLAKLPTVADAVSGTALAGTAADEVLGEPDGAAAGRLYETLDEALPADPGTVGDGAVEPAADEELSEIVADYEEAREWLDGLADRVKRRHGLTHVTVDRNKTDGYYVQVGKSEADEMPDEYREIKTLKNSKRFVTDELAERERTVLRLEEARAERERAVLDRLRERVAEQAAVVQGVGRALAELDALAGLAEHAAEADWCRPELTDGELRIDAGRHPTVEQTTEFVPNDLRMDENRGFLIVTGPNMSGKSTYMRQCALIVLLAQAGSFVPAASARVPVVDGIYTRVGALDELAQGRSTFMVEMQELSRILHSATDDSLVVLDEVGRGTATYDGISIAWAATEYLHNEVRAK